MLRKAGIYQQNYHEFETQRFRQMLPAVTIILSNFAINKKSFFFANARYAHPKTTGLEVKARETDRQQRTTRINDASSPAEAIE